MTDKRASRRADRRLFYVLTPFLLFGLCAPASAQTDPKSGADPGGAKPKAAPKRLSELRGDSETPTKDPSSSPSPKADSKKEPEPAPIGFFGDTSKFTRLGGWGSFGNAMGEFGFAKSTLIMMPPVQEELKLTDDQKQKLRELQDVMRKKGEEFGKSMREKAGPDPFKASENLPIAARVMQFTNMIGQFSSLARENEAGIVKFLKPAQRKRLNQIALQMEGISALTKPEIVEALGMSEEEEQAVRLILTQSRTMQMTTWIGSMMAMRPNRRNGDPNAPQEPTPPTAPKTKPTPTTDAKPDPAKPEPPADPRLETDPKVRLEREKAMRSQFETMRSRTDQIQQRAVREISNVLSKAQRAKFEIMLGPPFDPKKINNLGRPPQRNGEPTAPEETPPAKKS
jgi:LTXXQ motif family protein